MTLVLCSLKIKKMSYINAMAGGIEKPIPGGWYQVKMLPLD